MLCRGLCADKFSKAVKDLNLMISQRLKLPLGICPLTGSYQHSSHVVRLSGLKVCQAVTHKSLTRQTHAKLLLDSRQQSGSGLAARTRLIRPMRTKENTFYE